jgi:hypothetical protein
MKEEEKETCDGKIKLQISEAEKLWRLYLALHDHSICNYYIRIIKILIRFKREIYLNKVSLNANTSDIYADIS